MKLGRMAGVALILAALLAGGPALAQEDEAPARALVWLVPGQPGTPHDHQAAEIKFPISG